MEIFKWSEPEILCFFLVLLRIGSFWVSWPLFSGASVPNPLKILTVLSISLLLFPSIQTAHVRTDLASMMIIPLAFNEAVVGVLIGFICRFLFFILAMGGEMVSTSIGFSQGQIFNPTLGNHSTVVEQFYVLLGTLFFLMVRGHHYFLIALAESFKTVPLGHGLSPFTLPRITESFSHLFFMGFQMAAPVVLTILVLNFGLGVLGRAVPQLNILVTSFPLNVLVGLFVMSLTLPLWLTHLEGVAGETVETLFMFLKEF